MSNKVLIVDDESIQRQIITHIIKKTVIVPPPLLIYEAMDGNEAVQKVLSDSVNIIIMDITMPNCNGIEATEMIRMFNPKVLIYACTAADVSSEIQQKCFNVGMNGFFHKPFQMKDGKIVNKLLNFKLKKI